MAEPGSKFQVAQTPQPTGPLYPSSHLLAHGPQSLQHTWEERIETAQLIHTFKPIITRIKWDIKAKFIFLAHCAIFKGYLIFP